MMMTVTMMVMTTVDDDDGGDGDEGENNNHHHGQSSWCPGSTCVCVCVSLLFGFFLPMILVSSYGCIWMTMLNSFEDTRGPAVMAIVLEARGFFWKRWLPSSTTLQLFPASRYRRRSSLNPTPQDYRQMAAQLLKAVPDYGQQPTSTTQPAMNASL